ncbi:CcoQ/FixQ family Cbb3-type cytochrome c oxidase assembly chaperone [Azonexus sp.]|jgi:cytochrome c oxidase cbb3-type subunit 4|uniref:cbb3-type cytochrome oxidase subunit 3 n=1 Tax=Azonexus sp. TaxID=1872668 RepID=UPI0035D0330E
MTVIWSIHWLGGIFFLSSMVLMAYNTSRTIANGKIIPAPVSRLPAITLNRKRHMDINEMRSLLTVAGLICFLAIAWWAYSSKRRKDFDEAANLPFTDPEEQEEEEQRRE